ncbi:hypothetical protein ACOSQ3_028788 [Xanthoceras sorbifolium]
MLDHMLQPFFQTCLPFRRLGSDCSGSIQCPLIGLGVKISLPKSLVSSRGSMEFAKRFCSWSRDLSPVSVKMIRAARFSVATMAVLNHIGCQNLQKGTILVLAVAVGGEGSTKKNATTQSTGEPLPALQAGQLIATFFGLLGGGNWRKTARGKAKGRASRALIIISHSKSKESSHSKRLWPRPSRAVLACTSKQNSSLIILLCRQAWASKVRLD